MLLSLLLISFTALAQESKIDKFTNLSKTNVQHFVVGHAPLGFSFLSLSSDKDKKLTANAEIVLTKNKVTAIPLSRQYIPFMSGFDGYFVGGMSTTSANSDDMNFYLGYKLSFKQGKNGMGVKVSLEKDLLASDQGDTKGMVQAYVYNISAPKLFSRDLITLYAGYSSNRISILVSEKTNFLALGQETFLGKENVFFGVHYIPDFVKDYAVFSEVTINALTFGLSFNIN